MPALVLLATVLGLALLAPEALRLIVGSALVLLLPGAAVQGLVQHGRSLLPAQRLAVVVAASIGVVVLASIVLNLLPFGLQSLSWLAMMLLLGVILITFASWTRIVAALRRLGRRTARISATAVLVSALGALFLIGSFVVANRSVVTASSEAFTTLWVLPGDARVRFGFENFEMEPATYRLVMYEPSGRTVFGPIRLEPGAAWESSVSREHGPIRAVLFRDESSQPYREVWVREGADPASQRIARSGGAGS